MIRAYERVVRNKGAAGIDGLTVEELKDHLKAHWLNIKERLLEGEYQPQAVKKVTIPKPKGGERILGIPTVVDRLVQAGNTPETKSDVRQGLFGKQLWISPEPQRKASGYSVARPCAKREAKGRGYGLE